MTLSAGSRLGPYEIVAALLHTRKIRILILEF